MYGKHFASMYTGSMVGAGPTVFAVWGYVISHCTKDGNVELNPPILAAILGGKLDDINRAIDVLMAPDHQSRNKEHDGRRLLQVAPFLYYAPSYATYRAMRDEEDRREYMREYMAAYRKKKAAPVNNCVNGSKQDKPSLAHADADADADASSDAEQEPKKKRRASAHPSVTKPEGVTEQTWADWLALRKAKHAPVTETVLTHAKAEAVKAGMPLEQFLRVWCGRGSQGLEAAWLKPHERGPPGKPVASDSFVGKAYQGTPIDDLPESMRNAVLAELGAGSG